MKTEIQVDQEYTFEWTFYDMDIQLQPISGTIEVTKPGGTVLVAETAVFVETDGTIKYTLSSADATPVDENYRIELTYQVGDETFRPFYLFDITQTPLINTVRPEDLYIYLPELRDKVKTGIVETTSAGSTTTFVSTELSANNLDYKGAYVEIYLTDTTTHNCQITVYNKAESTATFTPAFTSTIASGLKVSVTNPYQIMIDEAYDNIVSRDIRNRIGVKARYIDSEVTRNMTIFRTLEMICFGKVESVDDKWDIRSQRYEEKYSQAYAKLSEPVDIDDDGQIDSYEDANRPNNLNKGIRR